MTDVLFYVLFNFGTGADSYHQTLDDALHAAERVGPTDGWVIRQVSRSSPALSSPVTRVVVKEWGCGHRQLVRA